MTESKDASNSAISRKIINSVDIVLDTGCWEWRKHVNVHGYGIIRVNKKEKYAHRISWETFIGPIAEGLTIDHLFGLCQIRGFHHT